MEETAKTGAVAEPGAPLTESPVAVAPEPIQAAPSKPSALWTLVGLAVIWACFYLVALAQRASDQHSPAAPLAAAGQAPAQPPAQAAAPAP